MKIHSNGKTIKYDFDCGKALHVKVGVEGDGTKDIRVIGEKNGTCARVVLGVLADALNLGLKRKLTIEDVIDICSGHICQHHCIGFRSCVDQLAKELKKEVK